MNEVPLEDILFDYLKNTCKHISLESVTYSNAFLKALDLTDSIKLKNLLMDAENTFNTKVLIFRNDNEIMDFVKKYLEENSP